MRNHIVSTGYNGTPMGVTNCADGGCNRCKDDTLRSGEGFDTCICAHAERNAIYFAARHGCATEQGTMYCTLKPCVWCVEACIQAGIHQVVYRDEWPQTYKAVPDYGKLLEVCLVRQWTPALEAPPATLAEFDNLQLGHWPPKGGDV